MIIKKIKEILTNLAYFLEYHDYKHSSENNSAGHRLAFSKSGDQYQVIFCTQVEELQELSSMKNMVLIRDVDDIQSDDKVIRAGGMVLDLVNSKRKGTSSIGEETVKYLSRYGIRFERVDQ